MTVFQVLLLILWLLIIPFCIGLLPMRLVHRDRQNAGVVLLAGYLLMLPVFWLITVPAMLFVTYDSFLVAVRIFTPVAVLLAAAGVGVSIYGMKKGTFVSLRPAFHWKDSSVEEKIEWVLFFGLLLFQLIMAFTLTSFDGDDSEYVARSLIAQQSNVMYTILPYSGGTTTLDIRHALAVFPMWVACIGRLSGVHATIVSHSVLPLVFIPLTYLVYFEIGKCLFKKKKELLPAFLVVMSLLQIFGNVSIYTRETFFLTRTWQGKSLAANLVMLSVVWLLLWIFDGKDETTEAGKKKNGLWLLLWLTNMTAGICTSQAAFFCVIIIGIAGFFMAIYERKFMILVKAGLVCIPNAAYMLLYLFLH